jgi:hypothetical protein
MRVGLVTAVTPIDAILRSIGPGHVNRITLPQQADDNRSPAAFVCVAPPYGTRLARHPSGWRNRNDTHTIAVPTAASAADPT